MSVSPADYLVRTAADPSAALSAFLPCQLRGMQASFLHHLRLVSRQQCLHPPLLTTATSSHPCPFSRPELAHAVAVGAAVHGGGRGRKCVSRGGTALIRESALPEPGKQLACRCR